MTQSSLFDHSCAFFCCQAAQAAGADGGAGKAVRPWITLKIRLGRGEASCAPAAPGQIEVAQSRRHFDLRRCSAGCSGIMTSPSPQRYLMQLWWCGLSVHTVHAQTLDTGMESLFCWWLKDGGQVIPMFCVRLMKLFRTLTQGSNVLVFNANSCFYSCDVSSHTSTFSLPTRLIKAQLLLSVRYSDIWWLLDCQTLAVGSV